MTSLSTVATRATRMDTRAPTHTREKRSRPRASVPHQYWALAPWFFSGTFMVT